MAENLFLILPGFILETIILIWVLSPQPEIRIYWGRFGTS